MTNTIEVKKTANGYIAIVNGRALMQFERPTEPYVFSSEVTARRAAEQSY